MEEILTTKKKPSLVSLFDFNTVFVSFLYVYIHGSFVTALKTLVFLFNFNSIKLLILFTFIVQNNKFLFV